MALALLDLLGVDSSQARMRIDTGTNRYYRLALGRATSTRDGFDWIDHVVRQTPVHVNPAAGGPFASATEVGVPIQGMLPGPLFAQLFSYKTPDGHSLGFSPVLGLNTMITTLPSRYADPQSLSAMPSTEGSVPPLCPPRSVTCRTCAEQFSDPAPRLDDLLAQIVKVAGPLVAQLLAPAGGTAAAAPSAAGGSGGTGAIGGLLQTLVGVLPGLIGHLSGAASLSLPQSTLLDPYGAPAPNRFTRAEPAYGTGGTAVLSQPMIFGIDDAVLIPLVSQVAGPLLQALPGMINSVNQHRLQMEQARNKLVSDVVGDVERRMLIEQILQAQQAAPSQAPDLQRLADLLRTADAGGPEPAAGPPPPAPAPAPAPAPQASPGALVTSRSLSTATQPIATALSARAIATFVTAPAIAFGGRDQVVFATGQPVTFQVKLAVTDPVPGTPLPKAIIRVVVKDPDSQRVLAEKVVKQRDLAANATVAVPLTADELKEVPGGRPLSALAEIRWRIGADGRGGERKALGSQDVMFSDRLFVKTRGGDAGPERELTDMNRFRPFWNKVWESPARGQTLWGVDVTMKYTVLPVADVSNGLMETRLSAPADTASDPLRAQTSGKLKAGVECSVDELAKLAALWDGAPRLDARQLAAFRTRDFAKQTASEAIVQLKLSGNRDQRGLIWAVPVFKLVDFTLGSLASIDDNGQVTGVAEEHASFPLPVSLRVLELVSGELGDESEPAGDEPVYHFDGYRVEHSDKVELIPHG